MRRHFRRRVLIGTLILAFVVALFLLGIHWWETRSQQNDADDTWNFDTQEVRYNGKTYVPNEDLETMLVIGLDTLDASQRDDAFMNDQQADFLMLFVMDRQKKTCTAYHINRDTMADMDVIGLDGDVVGTAHQQLALSHTYGDGKKQSCLNVVNAVSNLLNQVPIDHYVSVTMDAVPTFTDLVGGVRLTVMDDFSAMDASMTEGATVTLTGEQALLYVRARGGLEEPTNLRRMERQRQFLNALHASANRAVSEESRFTVNAYKQLASSIVTDCSADRLQTWMKAVSTYQLTGIVSMQGEAVIGGTEANPHVEFNADRDALMQDLLSLFYEEKISE